MPYPEVYHYLQIDRPIIDGASDRFISKVNYYAIRELGSTVTAAVTDLEFNPEPDSSSMSAGEFEFVDKPTTTPLLEVYAPRSLHTVLWRGSVPRQMSSRYSFSYVANALQIRGKSPRRRSSKCDQLDAISRQAGEDPGRTTLYCDTVATINTPGVGTEMILMPQEGRPGADVLEAQVNYAAEAVKDISRRAASLNSVPYAYVPFARLPETRIPEARLQRFLDSLQSCTLPVLLFMGNTNVHS